jgi:hypothetical protein
MQYVKRLRPSPAMIISMIALFIAGAGGAYAAAQIDGSDLTNNSVASKKVKNHTLKKKDLNKKLVKKFSQAGAPGQDGQDGQDGADGTDGTAVYAGPNWSIIDRNTEGSPLVALRAGPIFGSAAGMKPPLGVGSIGIVTGSNLEKVTFGNQVDFAGDAVADLDELGYSYFQTGEDYDRYAANAPGLQLEINPSVGNKDYTSMVYTPPAPATRQEQQWVDVDADADDGTGNSGWWFSSPTVQTATGCSQADFCSLSEAQDALVANNDGGPAAVIGTIGIGKGKDYQYQGAADALRINDTTYDFEPFGVTEVATP